VVHTDPVWQWSVSVDSVTTPNSAEHPCAFLCADVVFLSPTALEAGKDGGSLLAACAAANEVLRWDIQTRKLVESTGACLR
jgi:hypothetical protein